jgi:hypothetical protein|tara:strand:+ start:2499 stop:3422 length:924 start_codon:yes stop_codon:yes gene_type:complete
MTQNRKENIDEMTKDIAQHFDGLVFVDGYSDDGTFELLNERKGNGHIIQRKWTNDHDFQMNEFLRQGPMRNGDWFLMLDSPDRANEEWCKQLKEEVETYNEEGIGAVSFVSKVQLARYFDSMFYFQSPHWGLNGILGNIKGYTEEEKQDYITSTRFETDDPVIAALLHPVKYYYTYGRSNHTQLLYGQFGTKILSYHESQRLRFRLYCQDQLGLDLTLDSLEGYMRKGEFTDYFIDSVELEVNLKDFYRYKILEQDFIKEIDQNRQNWSFKYFLEKGKEKQDYGDYIGPINEYLKSQGKPETHPDFS